jgi:hypothetical protein
MYKITNLTSNSVCYNRVSVRNRVRGKKNSFIMLKQKCDHRPAFEPGIKTNANLGVIYVFPLLFEVYLDISGIREYYFSGMLRIY